MSSSLFSAAARFVEMMCAVCKISLPERHFEEHYVAFPLTHLGITGDFFLRGQTVGITLKGEDLRLFYLLQDHVRRNEIVFKVRHQGVSTKINPVISGEGKSSVLNPLPHFLGTISSGNLRDISDIPISRIDHVPRAEFLSNLLFTQWIDPIMPIVETYSRYKSLNLLVPVVVNDKPAIAKEGK